MWELIDRYFNAAKSKDTDALSSIFTDDAVYIERDGSTYEGIDKIRGFFSKRAENGNVAAWDIRKVIESSENGTAVWYYEYRPDNGDTISYDGVSVIETANCRIKRWSEYSQNTEKTYPA